MDLLGQFQDLRSIITIFATPLTMFKESCLFGVRTVCTIILTWIEVLRSSVILHRNLICGAAVWLYTIVSFPVRALTALQREKQMQMLLYDMQMALDHFASNDKQLREHLKRLTRKCRAMEEVIEEFDEEYDEALSNIQILQHQLNQLHNAKEKEIQGKEASNKHQIAKGKEMQETESSNYKNLERGYDHKHQDHDLANQKICQMREGALRQSLFGALLCPLVGMIIWESEDPCMPLVAALYAVVGMSLTSVIQLFWAIDKIKPALASDAVALLSFNCFILGTLTYPSLPRLAAPAMELLERTGLV